MSAARERRAGLANVPARAPWFSARRLICLVIGHGSDRWLEDGEGAAWITCSRCGAFRQGHSFHGGKPWLS